MTGQPNTTMAMNAILSRPLKIYFLPLFSQGHMIPSTQIARLFAARGLHVTIITTPCNAQLLENSIDKDINIHTIKFPFEDVGLPAGVENFIDVTDDATARKLGRAVTLLQQQVEPFIERNPPDCLVSDFFYTWTANLTNRLNIRRLVFNSFPLFAVCMIDAAKKYSELLSSSDSGPPFVITGLPHPVTLSLRPPKEWFQRIERLLEAELNSYGLIVNNFIELDGHEYVEHYKKTTGHKAWHIGPASLMLQNALHKDPHTFLHVGKEHEWIRWLDSKEPKSVVYICFGSLCHFPDEQLLELACGIEASMHHFLWVVHSKKYNDTEKWLPIGFEQRMMEEKRGMIIREWAPQQLILNHPAIGAFFTHCGWTSVTEGVSAGVPMITLPIFLEQFYNEKLITQVHGFGVEVGAEEWGSTPYDTKEKLVSREKIEISVRRLMDGGDESVEVRRRARIMGEKARKAVEESGSSYNNLTALIDDLKLLTANQSHMI